MSGRVRGRVRVRVSDQIRVRRFWVSYNLCAAGPNIDTAARTDGPQPTLPLTSLVTVLAQV